jgi:hypothetical protein
MRRGLVAAGSSALVLGVVIVAVSVSREHGTSDDTAPIRIPDYIASDTNDVPTSDISENSNGDQSEMALEDFVRRDVASYQGNLPMRLDEATIWETVVADGTHIRFGYRLDEAVPEQERDSRRAALSALIPEQICAAGEMTRFFELGGIGSFVYRDAEDTLIAEVEMDGSECRSLP